MVVTLAHGVGPITFRTACEAFTVPFSEGFNSTSTTESCWTVLDVNADGDAWNTNYDTTPFEGDQAAVINTDFNAGANNDWLISPAITLTGNQRLKFHYRVQSAGEPNDFELLLSTTGNTPASFTNTLIATASYSNITYVEQVVDLSAYSGDINIAWHVPNGGLDGWRLYIDNVIVEDIPSCVEPNTILASNVTSSTVDLSWTDGSGGLQFDYEYAIQAPATGEPTGAGAQIGDVTVVGEGFDIDGAPLTPNTLYEVYVRADCGGGDFSPWVGPITFRTACEAVGTINENFDGVTTPALPDCWSKILRGATLSSFATLTTTAVNINSAPNSVALYNSSSATTTTDDIILVSPVLSNLSAGTHRLKFYARTTGSIQVGTLNSNTASAVFTPIQTIATTETSTLYVVDFSTYAGTDTFIGFRHNAGTYTTIYVDDVVWEPIPATAPSCASNIVATPNPSCGNFANSITWDATPNSDGYYITVGTTSGGTDVANASSITTNTYSFSGNIGTTYFYTIVPFNAIGSATGCTEQSFTTNANGCYCESAPTSVDGTGITNVQLVATDFANTVSTAPVYNDHTATVVDMSQGINNNVQITFDVASFSGSYDYNTVIWIDANDNFTFESSEIVYTGVSATTAAPTLLNASFVIPAGISLGQHRMRIVATDNLQTPSNPCYSGTYGETADFTINVVAPSCEPPAATASVVYDCTNSQFSLDVNVTDLGNGSPVITDGTTTWPVTATGVVNAGPFNFGTPVTLTLLHGTDASCNLPLGIFNYGGCPPVNDDCDNAVALTVNTDFACSVVTPGTTLYATNSGIEPTFTVSGTPDNDVWFSFIATGPDHRVSLSNVVAVSGSSTDMGMAVFDGSASCNALVLVGSSDPNTYNLTGLTAGVTYYVSVYGWASGPGAQATFDICVGTPPAPPANDECSGAIALTVNADYNCGVQTQGTVTSATASNVDATACFGTEDDDVWYSFVATATTHRIQLNNVTGSTTDMYHSLWTGSDCGSLTLVTGSCSDPNTSNPTGLIIGQTYYLRIYTWTSTTGQTSTFDVCVGTDPALNADSFDNNNFMAYPNPVKDVLNLSYTSEISTVRVMNMLGQEVISRNLNATTAQVDMSQLSAGTYIVNVTIGDTVKTIKVVKQ